MNDETDRVLRAATNYDFHCDEIIVPVNVVFPTIRALVDREAGERWIVWCEQAPGSRGCADALKHRRVGLITEQMSRSTRFGSIDRFKSGELDTLVISLFNGSVGVDLTPCKRNIFLNPSADTWRERNQAIMRTDRFPQVGKVTTYFVFGQVMGP